MAISGVNSVQGGMMIPSVKINETKSGEAGFGKLLKDTIDEVNKSQLQSDEMTKKLVMGENVDLHSVMIASQKASITMQTTMEVRNKVIEAYQEIMRMPM